MEPSQGCIDLVKRSEGCQLSAYKDSVGVLTIGYGHTGPEVTTGLVWTLEQAEDALREDLKASGEYVDYAVSVPLTQGQFDALTDFCFNEGAGKLRTSTLLKLLNMGHYDQACAELYWVDDNGTPHGWIYGGGMVLGGLITRRKAEQQLWQNP